MTARTCEPTFKGADEGDFLELLVASERISDWLERIRARGSLAKQKTALLQLKAAVQAKATYAEEARQAGIVHHLTKVLATSDDEEVLDAASLIISACSGPLACCGKVSEQVYDGIRVHIREGMLGDGLGAKVWLVAHILCRELTGHPAIVAGKRVLEVGAGCGVAGITAAKAAAAHVTLTDIVPAVLRNLRECVQLNVPASGGDGPSAAPTSASASQQDLHGAQERAGQPGQRQPRAGTSAAAAERLAVSDQELFDEAEEVDDFDFGELLGRPAPGAAEAAAASSSAPDGCASSAWDAGNMSVRTLDWAASVAALDGAPPEGLYGTHGGTLDPEGSDMPPEVEPGQQWPVIIGSEVIYEPAHAQMLAAVIKHRLAPGGCAVLNCAVRELRVFELFAKECAGRGLRYRRHQVRPEEEYAGILGRDTDYEGGFLLMALDHAHAPCGHWHRDDFETVL